MWTALSCFAAVVALWSPTAAAQTVPGSAASADVAEDSAEAPHRVDVKPIARDSEIESRLSEILTATGRFHSPTVSVQNGVVFIEGEAKEPEFKQWATTLANSTQDVVAVVNRLTVAEKSMWDFSAAYSELKDFRNATTQAIPIVLFALAVLVITWLVTKLAAWSSNRVLQTKIPNSLLRWVVTRAIMLPILIFGLYLILRVSGLTQLALTVLGGTGLVGLIIGIAFQDIAENFLASILLSVQQPFRVGDYVRIEGHEGIVQRVTTRGTSLLTQDGNHVQIPNAVLYKSTIENFTANPLRRVQFRIGIGYDDPTTEAQKVVLGRVKTHKATLNDPPPRVLLEELGASTINLLVFVWIDGTKHDVLSVRSSCMRIVKQALLKAGISLPDEAREVIFPNGVPVEMISAQQKKSPTQQQPAGEVTDASASQFVEYGSDRRSQDFGGLPVCTIDQQPDEADESEAEGNMTSEVEHLQKQAKHSWLPGEEEDVLLGKS